MNYFMLYYNFNTHIISNISATYVQSMLWTPTAEQMEREFSVSSDSQRLSHQLNTDTLTLLLYITHNSSILDIIWVHLIIVTSTLSLREKLNSCCIDSSWAGRIFLSSPPSRHPSDFFTSPSFHHCKDLHAGKCHHGGGLQFLSTFFVKCGGKH